MENTRDYSRSRKHKSIHAKDHKDAFRNQNQVYICKLKYDQSKFFSMFQPLASLISLFELQKLGDNQINT